MSTYKYIFDWNEYTESKTPVEFDVIKEAYRFALMWKKGHSILVF